MIAPSGISNKKAVISFILLAFTITYLLLFLVMMMPADKEVKAYIVKIAVSGIAISGIIIARKQGRLSSLMHNCLPRIEHLPYYLSVLVLFVLLMVCTVFFRVDLYDFGSYALQNIHFLLLEFIIMLIFIGYGEEIGWRGVLLPNLLTFKSPFFASLIIAHVWFIWHFPKLIQWIEAPSFIVNFYIGTVALSIIFSWIYIRLNSDIFLIAMVHSLNNILIDWFYKYITFKQLSMNTAFHYWIFLTGIFLFFSAVIMINQQKKFLLLSSSVHPITTKEDM